MPPAPPGRQRASRCQGRHTPGPGIRRRQLHPEFRATRCCRENVRPGKDECEERSVEERGRARFLRHERPGCGAGLSRAGASRPIRGSGLLTRWGLDTLRSRPRPPCAKQGRVECHPRDVHTHGAPRRMPSQRLARKPRVSTPALAPRSKPEAELPAASRPLSPREKAWPRRGWRKPQGGCVPGLRSGAVLEGGPRPGPQRSPSQGRRERLLPRP